MTQEEKVLAWLRTRRKINAVEAVANLGIYRLAAVVHTLRRKGHDIVSREIEGTHAVDYIMS